MNHKVRNIVKRAFSGILILLIVNLNLNALYQTSQMNPDSSCHSEIVEMSCCDMGMEQMTEADCSLNKWLGTNQISSCTCLHELNEQSSVIINTGKLSYYPFEKVVAYNYDQTDSSRDYITNHSSENYKYLTTQIYLIDSALLI